MKLRLPFALPPLDRTARLPLTLAALLGAALAFQLVAVNDIDLPPAGPVGGARVTGIVAFDLPPAKGGATILARSMFAPGATQAASTGDEASPMGGVTVAGSVRVGDTVFAVVQGPGNRIANVRVGGQIGEWRLRAIRGNDALLVRGEEKIIVPFGVREPLSTTAAVTGNQ